MKEKIIALYIRLSVEDRDLDELKTASVSIQNQKVHLGKFVNLLMTDIQERIWIVQPFRK